LKIADHQIVQIHTSSHFHPSKNNHITEVKNSGKEELIASKVAPLTEFGIFNFFHIIDNCFSKIPVQKFKANITITRLIITTIQFVVTNLK